jgi:hypothetical protein
MHPAETMTRLECQEPLFSEFSSPGWLCRLLTWIGVSPGAGLQPMRTTLILFGLGSASTLLSVLSDAAVIIVPARGQSDRATRCLEFGFLAEPSHGLMLLVFAPLICYFGLKTLHECSILLCQFQKLGRVSATRSLASGAPTDDLGDLRNATPIGQRTDESADVTPARLISRANGRIFNWLVLLVIASCIFGRTFGNEFWPLAPHKGDRYTVALGYVQADKVAAYEPGRNILVNGGSVTTLVRPNGPQGGRVVVFWMFLMIALFTHAAFACFVVWLSIKFVFVCCLFAFAVANATGHDRGRVAGAMRRLCGGSISITIDTLDTQNQFGLASVLGSFRFCLWLLITSGMGSALALGTDASRLENLRASVAATGGVGIIPLVIMGSLFALFLLLFGCLEDYRKAAADEAAVTRQREAYDRIKQQRVAFVSNLLPLSMAAIFFSAVLPFLAGDLKNAALTDGRKLLKVAVESTSHEARARLSSCPGWQADRVRF